MSLNITKPNGNTVSVGMPSEGQTMRLSIGTGIVDAALNAQDFYGVLGSDPDYVAAFSDSYYRVDRAASTFAGALNFARTGTATYVDSTGTLQTAATGVARLNHHVWSGSAWVNEGLLLESGAATNLTLDGNDFDPATTDWITSTLTQVQNATGIDGTTSAWTFTATASSSNKNTVANLTTITDSANYTVSKYIKKGNQRYQFLYFTNAAGDDFVSCIFDLDTGLVSQTYTGGTGSLVATYVEAREDGFYRLGLAGSLGTGNTQCYYGTAIAPSANPAVGTFGLAGVDATGTETFIGTECQFEAGSVPTSLVRTTGTTASRNAETLTASAADLPYNLTAVSIQMEGVVNGTPSTLIDWQADASNLITLSAGASDFTFTQERAGTVDSVTGGSYTSGINVPFNIASRHGSTFINGAVDGTTLTANTTPTALPDLTTTDLDIAPNFNGTIKRLRIWGADVGDAGIAAASA